MTKILLFIFVFLAVHLRAQDSLNRIDENGLKQGHWIYFGKDRPESRITSDGKVEEGNYIDDRKEGIWIKYHDDGKTPKLKGEYVNNRPSGNYIKYWPSGEVRDTGTFQRNTAMDSLKRGGVYDREVHIYFTPQQCKNVSDSAVVKTYDLPVTPKSPNTNSIPFKNEGYNKVYNEDGEIWLVGKFRNGQLWDGKVYDYDREGILLGVRIFKSGLYHSNGRL